MEDGTRVRENGTGAREGGPMGEDEARRGGAREGRAAAGRGHRAEALERQPPLQWPFSWQSTAIVLGISAVGVGLGVGALVYVLFRYHKNQLQPSFEADINRLESTVNRLESMVNRLESTVNRLESTVNANSRRIGKLEETLIDNSALQDKVKNIEDFVVEMAQRQKWPWPLNNRLKGLEDQLELSRK